MSKFEGLSDSEAEELIAGFVEQTAFEGAPGRAKARQPEVTVLYDEIIRCGAFSGWPEDTAGRAELSQRLERAHVTAIEDTYDTTVVGVTPKGREVLFSLIPEIERRSREYERGSRASFIAEEPALEIPQYPENISLEDFVHALIVSSNVKWMPIKAAYEGVEFTVLPISEEFVLMRELNRLFVETDANRPA